MAALRHWILAARPRTLAAGLAPVLVGTALAGTAKPVDWALAGGCLLGALLIQVAVNYANDAFDALKGADTPDRLGPTRAVAAGLISARAMLVATAIILALALGVGLWLSTAGGWPILALGLVSLVCAVAYTGCPFPLAYKGLGDLFVLLFFGWFAVLGSAWVQVARLVEAGFAATDRFAFDRGMTLGSHWILRLPPEWWLIASAIGLQATAIIAVNNLRDIPTDAAVGKRTLAVRLGDRATRVYYAALHAAATACWIGAAWLWERPGLALPAALAALGGAALSFGVCRTQGRGLNRFLGLSAALELVTSIAAVVVLRPGS